MNAIRRPRRRNPSGTAGPLAVGWMPPLGSPVVMSTGGLVRSAGMMVKLVPRSHAVPPSDIDDDAVGRHDRHRQADKVARHHGVVVGVGRSRRRRDEDVVGLLAPGRRRADRAGDRLGLERAEGADPHDVEDRSPRRSPSR